MCLYNLISAGTFATGLVLLYFALNAFAAGQLLGGLALSLFGAWFTYGGFKGMTRKEWPR